MSFGTRDGARSMWLMVVDGICGERLWICRIVEIEPGKRVRRIDGRGRALAHQVAEQLACSGSDASSVDVIGMLDVPRLTSSQRRHLQ